MADKSKNWKNEIHLGVNLDARRHHKYRESKARAMWELVRRLTRLPSREKRKIIVSQIIPILTYGAELHHTPTESAKRLASECHQWIAGGYRGGSRERLRT